MAGLTHSASTPSLDTLNSQNGGLSLHKSLLGGNLSARTSPVTSARSTPHGSPAAHRHGTNYNEEANYVSGPSDVAAQRLPGTFIPVSMQGNSMPLDMIVGGGGVPQDDMQPGVAPSQDANSMQDPAAGMQDMVGGTTYFYTPEQLKERAQYNATIMPNFTMYPGMLPHMAHMKAKSNVPSFFMVDELKSELLNKQAASLAHVESEQSSDIPQEVDNYRQLCPMEPAVNSRHKSSTFGYQTSCYKAVNKTDGQIYCLRRIHGFRLASTKFMTLIDIWKKIQQSNIVQLREVFTTKVFGGHSMVFVYDFHPCAETMMDAHFSKNAFVQRFKDATHYNKQGLLPESLIWSYIVQLSAALRTVHNSGLACRVIDPTKIIISDRSRLRINGVGVFDVLSFDANQQDPLRAMSHFQQQDLLSLGRVVLSLACGTVNIVQHDTINQSIDIASHNYSPDLKNLMSYLLHNHQGRLKSVNDIMPMIGARFYTQLDIVQMKCDVLENELSKEVECGRLFRLLVKLNVINDRPEFNNDPAWAETGDRYMLKLFRDFLFHQVDSSGSPWIDMSHIVQSLNKLDARSPEKISLMSQDEQNMLMVSFRELHNSFQNSFAQLQETPTTYAQHTVAVSRVGPSVSQPALMTQAAAPPLAPHHQTPPHHPTPPHHQTPPHMDQ